MLGAIAGDIVGSAYEASGVKHYAFPLFTEHSRFTDDTAMTVAVARAVLEQRDYAECMREIGRRFPFAGFGGRFRDWLLDDTMPAPGSWGNGGAMRVSAIGLMARSEDEALREARRSAEPTHGHPEGIRGAEACALAVYLAREGASKEDLREAISGRFGYDLSRTVAGIRDTYSFSVSARESVPEAILCFLDAGDFDASLRNAVSLGGDADTMAAIAGSIAEAFWKGIPEAFSMPIRERLPEDFVETVTRFQDKYCPHLRVWR